MSRLQLVEEQQLMDDVRTKVNFRVKQDADGYPPVAVESLWAKPVAGAYVIDSIPFFTSEATNGDHVAARKGEGDALWFERVLQRSGNSLIRVVMFNLDDQDALIQDMTRLGCGTEGMRQFKLLAVDIPHEVSLRTFRLICRLKLQRAPSTTRSPS
jgi:hypothetical protein